MYCWIVIDLDFSQYSFTCLWQAGLPLISHINDCKLEFLKLEDELRHEFVD